MKNIHVLPTSQPSRLYFYKGDNYPSQYGLRSLKSLPFNDSIANQNIYIASDEEIIGGKEWFLDLRDNFLFKNQVDEPMSKVLFPNCKKIILTTDPQLIQDSVQAIDDEFLEYFIGVPFGEIKEIEVEDNREMSNEFIELDTMPYKIIIPKEELTNCEHCGGDGIYITADSERVECPMCEKGKVPKEEPKQETLEEVAIIHAFNFYEKEDREVGKQSFIEGAKWQDKRSYSEEEVLKLLEKRDKYVGNWLPPIKWFEQFKKK